MSRRRLLAVASTAGLALALLAGQTDAGAVEPAVVEFVFTGAPETFVVPDGVTELTATTCGAQGGDSATSIGEAPGPSQPGGLGGCATSTLAVTPGEELTIVVGGQGSGSASLSFDPISIIVSGPGGFNGGANGGAAGVVAVLSDPDTCLDTAVGVAAAGGGGGGASDIRQGGDGLDDRVLVGGGGGGGGAPAVAREVVDDLCQIPIPSPAGAAGGPAVTFAESQAGSGSITISGPHAGADPRAEGGSSTSTQSSGPGGAGGGDPAEDGGNGVPGSTAAPGSGGGGGTGAGPGAGGAGVFAGDPGTAGDGGQAFGNNDVLVTSDVDATTVYIATTAAGGGGGGGFGGGGGGAGALEAVDDIAGSGGGGGGSGSGPTGVAYEAGVNAGDGSVTISYGGDDVPPEPEPPDVVGVIEARPTFTG